MAVAEPNWRPSTLGGFLAYARDLAGLNQQTLAEACGVSRPLVSKWEADARLPDFHELEEWATTTRAKWLIPTLKKAGLVVKVERWESVNAQSTSARMYAPLSLAPPLSGRRYLSPPANPLLGVVKDE